MRLKVDSSKRVVFNVCLIHKNFEHLYITDKKNSKSDRLKIDGDIQNCYCRVIYGILCIYIERDL